MEHNALDLLLATCRLLTAVKENKLERASNELTDIEEIVHTMRKILET